MLVVFVSSVIWETWLTKVKLSHYGLGQALMVSVDWGSQISRQSAHEGGKVGTGRHYPAWNIPGTHFCYRLSWPQSHSVARTAMKNSSDTIGNWTHDLWLIIQCLKQLHYYVPWPELYLYKKDTGKIMYLVFMVLDIRKRYRNLCTVYCNCMILLICVNRILGMPVDLQNRLFKYFTDTLNAIITQAKKSGRFDMGILGKYRCCIHQRNTSDWTYLRRCPNQGVGPNSLLWRSEGIAMAMHCNFHIPQLIVFINN
jgi:hypothetical protein